MLLVVNGAVSKGESACVKGVTEEEEVTDPLDTVEPAEADNSGTMRRPRGLVTPDCTKAEKVALDEILLKLLLRIEVQQSFLERLEEIYKSSFSGFN